MMACKFTYNTVQAQQGQGHSIQLKKRNENRTVLIMGRKYLDEFGQKILNLNIGKHKDELPPYLIRDKLDSHIIDMIENGIVSLIIKEEVENSLTEDDDNDHEDNLQSLEHEISSIIGDDCFDLETREMVELETQELMDVIKDDSSSLVKKGHVSGKKKGGEMGGQPATPETEKTDSTNESKSDKKQEEDSSSPTDMVVTTPSRLVVKNNGNIDLVDKDHHVDEVNGNGTEEETMEKSQHSSTKSIDLDSVHCKSDNSALIDGVVRNGAMCPSSPIHRSFDFANEEQIQLIDIQCLSPEQKSKLKKLTSINLQGLDEDEAIISIIEGNNLNQKDTQSRSYGFVSKLKNLAGAKKDRRIGKAPVQEEEKKNENGDDEDEAFTKPQVTIKETDDVRKIYDSDELISSNTDHVEIDYLEKINEINLDHVALPQNGENAIKFGIRFFFAVFVGLFNEFHLHDEQSCCPIEIVFRLWKAILRTEQVLDGVQTKSILEAFEAVSVSISENDFQIESFETLGGIDLKICNFIKAALTNVGIICVESIEQYYVKENLNSGFTFTSIALKSGPYSAVRRKCIAKQVFPSIDEKSLKWHDIIIRGCKEILNCELSTEDLYNDPEPSNQLSIWYAIRYLPYHITSHGSYKDSLNMLLDKNFTIHRINSCGCTQATIQHLKDSRITTKAMAENDDENCAHSDYQQAASKAIRELILEVLEEMKKDVGDMLKKSSIMSEDDTFSSKRRAFDIGSAMHQLGRSFGQAECYQKEIDVYSEALRLKTVSGCPESQLINTLLSMSVCYRHLGNPITALSRLNEVLKIETKCHGEVHSNIGALSQYKGLIQCELGEFNEALSHFQTTLRIHKILNIPSGIVVTLCLIGKVQQEVGEYLLALDSFQTAKSSLDMIEQSEGLRHAEILQVRKIVSNM